MESIYNATPMHISRGFEVARFPKAEPAAPAEPIHYPHVWGFAERGKLTPQTVTNNFTQLYGADTLKPRKPYLTHQGVLAKVLAKNANQFKFQRLVPEDATRASSVTYVAISDEKVEETIDSGWARDNADPINDGATVQRRLVTWVTESLEVTSGQTIEEALAALQESTKKKSISVSGKSIAFTLYPVFADVREFGKFGNRCGYTIDTLDENTADPLDVDQARRIGGRLHTLRFWERPEGLDSPSVLRTRYGKQGITFSLVGDAFDPRFNTDMSLTYMLDDGYTQLDSSLPAYPTFAPYEYFTFYEKNYRTAIEKIDAEEKELHDDMEDPMMMSLFTGRDVQGNDYYSFRTVHPSEVTGGEIQSWGHKNVVYCQGGEDGDLSNENFDLLVRQKVENFGPEYYQVSREKYPIGVFYDTGFEIETKEAMATLTAKRRDVAVFWSTHIHGAGIMTPQEEKSIARAIVAASNLVPESTYFGTEFCRGLIQSGSGEYVMENLPFRVSQLLHIADLFSKYMGAGNGEMVAERNFSEYPGNRVEVLKNLSNVYVPDEIRVGEWKFGINRVIPFDEFSYHSPGVYSMFADDQTPMKSAVNMMIAIQAEKAARRVWHRHAGVDRYSKEVLRGRIERSMREEMNPKRFDNRLSQMDTQVIYTKDDLIRGYSWSGRYHLRLAMPHTVGVMDILVDRLEEGISPETYDQ